MAGYFGDHNSNEQDRRNYAFQFLCAIRECISMVKRTAHLIPYRRMNEVLYEFDPELQKDVNDLLTKTNESEIVKYYKQRAVLESQLKQTEVSAIELIDLELNHHIQLLANSTGDDRQIKRKILELETAKEHFTPEDISENTLLNHDFSGALSRFEYFNNPLYKDDKFIDYKLPDQRILRLRLFHPDKAERVIGTDLLYEQFDLTNKRVRFVHLQYKTWNTNILYFVTGNLNEQIDKLGRNLCSSGYCYTDKGKWNTDEFRFQHCSAFLRPTSSIEKPDSNLVTSGNHIPICTIKRIREVSKYLSKENIKERNLSSKIFEELFITNMIGSRWVTFDELDKFYKEKEITSNMNKIRVHAQEVAYRTEEQEQGDNEDAPF